MVIDQYSGPVYLALIGLVTLIVQNWIASRGRAKIIDNQIKAAGKLDEVHALTNSSLTAGIAREAQQAAVIQELRGAIANTAQATAVNAATAANPPKE